MNKIRMKARSAFRDCKQMAGVSRAAVVLCMTAFMMLTQDIIVSNAKSNFQTRPSTTPSAYSEYTGYMDECVQWTGYRQFENQDYDGDGCIDRVFRTYRKNTEYCHYKIVFGNQMVIDVSDEASAIGTPSVQAADINGDGKNEIIFTLRYDTSSDMRAFGDLVVYEKKGDAYVEAQLPFERSGQGYTQGLTVRYKKKRKQLITVSLDDIAYSVDVPISQELWKTCFYRDHFKRTSVVSTVWDAFVMQDGQDAQLVCSVHLFDKWSNYGLLLKLGYEDQRYILKDVILTSDEFKNFF